MAAPFTFSYSEQDYVNASALHWRRAILGFKFLSLFGAACIASGLIYGGIAWFADGSWWEAVIVGCLAALGAGVLLGLMALINRLFVLPRMVRRNFRQMKEYQDPWTFTVGEDKLGIHNSRGEALLPYADFIKWDENDKIVMVYRSERLFNLIPRAALPEADAQALRARMAAAGVPLSGFRNS